MKVNRTNRSRRMIYLVVLLAFAVALSTALVLAGERNGGKNPNKDARQATSACPNFWKMAERSS